MVSETNEATTTKAMLTLRFKLFIFYDANIVFAITHPVSISLNNIRNLTGCKKSVFMNAIIYGKLSIIIKKRNFILLNLTMNSLFTNPYFNQNDFKVSLINSSVVRLLLFPDITF